MQSEWLGLMIPPERRDSNGAGRFRRHIPEKNFGNHSISECGLVCRGLPEEEGNDKNEPMNAGEPDNRELDTLFMRTDGHPEARPAFFEAMLEAELYTLVPRGMSTRPAESVARPQGKNLQIIRWGNEGREYYIVYTSARLARQGLRNVAKTSKQKLLIIALPGRELLKRIQRPGVGIAINAQTTDTHHLAINDQAVEMILSGGIKEALQSRKGEWQSRDAMVLKPEQYPLKLVQPVFDYLKTRPEVLAGWVLHPVEELERGESFYVFALLTTAEETRDLEASVMTVLNMVNSDDRKGIGFSVTTLDYSDAGHTGMIRGNVPFYAAPDYKAPAVEG